MVRATPGIQSGGADATVRALDLNWLILAQDRQLLGRKAARAAERGRRQVVVEWLPLDLRRAAWERGGGEEV